MRRFLIALEVLLGLTAAIATLQLEKLSSSPAMVFLMPGMLIAVIASGNVHVFPIWVAALGNLFFYLFLTWTIVKVGAKFN
jgi:hypothetical protein